MRRRDNLKLQDIKNKRESLVRLVEDEKVNFILLHDFDWLVEQVEKSEQAVFALKEIQTMTESLVEMNPTYRVIHNIAAAALGEDKNEKEK